MRRGEESRFSWRCGSWLFSLLCVADASLDVLRDPLKLRTFLATFVLQVGFGQLLGDFHLLLRGEFVFGFFE